MRRKPYKGDLARQILLPDRTAWHRFAFGKHFVWVNPARKEDDQIRRDAEASRLPLLFSHFGISQTEAGAWQKLALALARSHVPGFEVARSKGAPTKITADTLYQLYMCARRKKSALAGKDVMVSQRHICEALSRDKQFPEQVPELKGLSAKRLANLLSDAMQLRRANVTSRWERRATARALAEAGIPEDEWPMFDSVPYWPGSPNPFAREITSRED